MSKVEVVMNMSSDLEYLVETDMSEHGYNPYNPADVNSAASVS